MKERILKTTIEVYDSANDLKPTDRELMALARASLEHSYSPYSKFKVGAAILLKSGKMLGGSNQENAAYSMCLCAERVALSVADSQFPGEPILSIAVTIKNNGKKIEKPAAPCGACRQSICEAERKLGQDIRVIIQGEAGEVLIFQTAKDLLPFSFDETYL